MFSSSLFLLLSITPLVYSLPAPQVPPTLFDTTESVFIAPHDFNSPQSGPLMMAYYPDWVASIFPPENIDFSHFDWIDFAFAVPDAQQNLLWDDPDDAPELLNRLVRAAHAQKCKVKLSIGGWSGSKYFSPAVATEDTRKKLAINIRRLYDQYELDGIDIDWEYPGQEGGPGNQHTPEDTGNFLSFLELLRITLPPSAIMTVATQTEPFVDASGNPSTDMSAFAKVLDWFLLMNYDVWGSSSAPGPNAPLHDGCHNSTQPNSNAVAALEQWNAAGVPVNQLVLGLPYYGYISKSTATSLRSRNDPQYVSVVSEDGTSEGQITFSELMRQGALVRASDGHSFVAGGGFERSWDRCSATPFLTSLSAGQVVTYDDTESLKMKAQFVRETGMRGVDVWTVTGDVAQWDLTNAVLNGLGLV